MGCPPSRSRVGSRRQDCPWPSRWWEGPSTRRGSCGWRTPTRKLRAGTASGPLSDRGAPLLEDVVEGVDAGDGARLRPVGLERARVERFAAGAAHDAGIRAFDDHHPACHLVRLVADFFLRGLDRRRPDVGLAEVGGGHARPLEKLGQSLLAEPPSQRGFAPDRGTEANGGQRAADAAAHGHRGPASRAIGVPEEGEALPRPRRRMVETLHVGGTGEGGQRLRLVHHEILRRGGDGDVAAAAQEARHRAALRHVLSIVPVDVVGLGGGLHVGPEGQYALAEEAHAADATRASLTRQEGEAATGGWDTLTAMPTSARRTWTVVVRLLERDERLFAFLLAVVMVGGLATLGLALRPRHRIDLPALVFWFAMYKVGILALVSVNPSEQKTRAVFSGALAVDMMLIFALLYLTGGGDSLFVNLFYPLLAVNAYYFGRWVALILTMLAGLFYWAAALLAPPAAAWTAVAILMGMVGLPAFAVGHVAERERRARAEGERLNAELTGTLTRLQAAQADLVVAERMATVGRLSLKMAHEVRNPIAAIELNAELLGDIVRERPGPEMEEAGSLLRSIRDQVSALDALTEEYLAFARFPRAQFEEDSVNDTVIAVVEFVKPLATRQGITVTVATDPSVPSMEIDRTLLRQAVLNLIKNGLEALSTGGTMAVPTRRLDDT